MNELAKEVLATIILVVLIPVAIVGAVLYGILHFITTILDFLKSYFDIIKKIIGDTK